MERVVRSNVVGKKALREVQVNTLNKLADYLMMSAGPNGSTTMIPHEMAHTTYTKDGKSILEQIKFIDTLENSIVNELVELAAYVVKEVGDGTTSLVVMIANVFDQLYKNETDGKHLPYQLIRDFITVVNDLKDIIASKGKEVTVDDIYKICMISTNGNEELSESITEVYRQYGMSVYMNLGVSNDVNTIVKAYDGLTLPYGYFHSSFVNNTKEHSVDIRNPRVYAFKDNVDTPEMIAFFDTIVAKNIIEPITKGDINGIVPTVIMTPMLSRDLSNTIDTIVSFMNRMDQDNQHSNKPPFLIVNEIMDDDEYEDIVKLCNCKLICKYINPERQREDIEAGLAPTLETICDWYGKAEQVTSNKDNTTFINPELIYEKGADGNYVLDEDMNPIESTTYKSMIKNAEEDLASLIKNNGKLTKIADARRRLNNLKANMVDFLVGGITTTDRDSAKHLAEDAIYNCRSAVKYGYGYAANYEGLNACYEYYNTCDESVKYIVDILIKAYENIIKNLYASVYGVEKAEHEFEITMKEECMPINLRTNKYDGTVLTSIMSDQVILECIAKIISIMFTTNQAIVMNPAYNVYDNE